MQFFRSPVLITFGAILVVAGFVYDGLFAGLPYQDPTEEMQSQWLYHSGIARRTVATGLIVFCIGILWGLGQIIARGYRTGRHD